MNLPQKNLRRVNEELVINLPIDPSCGAFLAEPQNLFDIDGVVGAASGALIRIVAAVVAAVLAGGDIEERGVVLQSKACKVNLLFPELPERKKAYIIENADFLGSF